MISYPVEEIVIPLCTECRKPSRACGLTICQDCAIALDVWNLKFQAQLNATRSRIQTQIEVDNFARQYGKWLRLADFPQNLRPHVEGRVNRKAGGLKREATKGGFRYIHVDVHAAIAKSKEQLKGKVLCKAS